MGTTTTVHLDPLRFQSGAASFSYTPHDDRVRLAVYDSDNYGISQVAILDPEDLEHFKTLLAELGEVIRSEKARRHTAGSGPKSFDDSGDFVPVPIEGTSLPLPTSVYKEASALIANGQTVVAAAKISEALPWMAMSGARAVAQSIADYQRAIGDRG